MDELGYTVDGHGYTMAIGWTKEERRVDEQACVNGVFDLQKDFNIHERINVPIILHKRIKSLKNLPG